MVESSAGNGSVESQHFGTELKAAFEEAGRDPATLRISVFGSQPDIGRIEHYGELGVERVTLWLPPAGRDTVLPILDKYGELLAA